MRRTDWRFPVLVLTAGLVLAACGGDDGGPSEPDAVIAYGVTPAGQLVHFDVTTPNSVSSVAITGLGAGKAIRAIDFRVSDGALFGLGSDGLVYSINSSTGAATALGDTLAAVVSGATFGFDWNPVVDRLRVQTDLDDNLRVNPNDGLLVATDGDVAFNTGDVNDGDNPQLVASAYANNTDTATVTSLYVIDQGNDVLALQNPPNAGVLVTVGPLGVNVAGDVGFDIAPDGTAYAAIVVQGSSAPGLYTINLTTGAATLVGAINSERLTGFSIKP